MPDKLLGWRAGVSPGARSAWKWNRRGAALAVAAGACCLLVAPAAADVDPLSGIDFVHITDPGNAPWMGNPGPRIPGDNAIGRGGVDYNYSIGRMEVTTAQWIEFFNAAFDRPDPLPHLIPPSFWGGAATTPNTPGGRRWSVPAGNENMPVGNISWRMAAMYCNWLCNEKGTDRAAFMNGAYDVSTFGYTGSHGDIFTDQLAHNPDARYWIPTWDEWLKAAHYDPAKNGGEGGWWMFSKGSDDPYVYGPPGEGEANAHFQLAGNGEFRIPLGSYPDVTSPWGLLDTAGGTSEWTESYRELLDGRRFRLFDGSSLSGGPPHPLGSADWIQNRGGEFPNISTFDFGLRIASVVPAPSAVSAFGCVALLLQSRRRRSRYA